MARRIFRTLMAIVIPLLPIGAISAEFDPINIAGEQRMLSQRIVKSWVQIGVNVLPALSRAQLDEATRRFEENLRLLDQVATSPQARTAISGLNAAWGPLRNTLRGVVRQSDATVLDARAEDVLMAADRLTRALQDQSAAPTSRWVNLAGRQRMLSQRLVKLYMLRQWGIDNSTMRDELERVHNEFSGALGIMQQNADNSPAIRVELDNLSLQWEWLRTALATEGAGSFSLILAESGEAVLQLADQITNLYVQSSR